MTYRLLPRLKRSARGWSRTLCTQITKFTCLYTFLNVGNPQKVKNKNIDFWKLHFFWNCETGGSKSENIIVFIFSLNLDSFWPRNDFIGHFDEIYYKKWSKSKVHFFGICFGYVLIEITNSWKKKEICKLSGVQLREASPLRDLFVCQQMIWQPCNAKCGNPVDRTVSKLLPFDLPCSKT